MSRVSRAPEVWWRVSQAASPRRSCSACSRSRPARGTAADLAALDDELTADDVRRTAGPAMLAAVAGQRGPERDLAAHVALGQPGDLDVVDVVAGIEQRVAQAAEQHGLAGAGRGDHRRGHTGLDGGVQAGKRVVEKRQAEELVGRDLAG